MTWYNNLRIGLKFILSFGVLTILVALMGITGIISTRNIEGQVVKIHNTTTVPLKQLAELINHFQRMKVQSRDILMAASETEVNASIKKIYTYTEGTRKILPDLMDRVKGTPLEEQFMVYEQKFTAYEKQMRKLISIVQAGQKDNGDALLRGEIYSSAREAQVVLEGLLEKMSDWMESTYNANLESTARSQNTFMLFVIGGIILAVLLSIASAKSFTKRIVIITNAIQNLKENIILNLHDGAERLAMADLDLKIPKDIALMENNYHDEVGVLADNVNEIITLLLSTVASIEKSVHNIKDMVDETNRFAESASNGDLHYRCTVENYVGGFRHVVEGLNNTAEAFASPMQETIEILEQVSAGNLTLAMHGQYKGEYNALALCINTLITSLRSAISEVENAVVATADAVLNITANAERMASGAAEQDRQAQEVVTSVGEMENVIEDSARNAAIAADASKQAHSVALEGGANLTKTVDGMNHIAKVVTEAADQVQELSKSNVHIGEIVLVINDIAEQTNLLALNAAIEAARAGEQGRGFAIVADEVRKLAERTSKATGEIENMIKKVQQETTKAIDRILIGANEADKGKKQADTMGNAMTNIVKSAVKVSSVIEQVAAASEEQLSSLQEMRRNIEVISEVTHESTRDIIGIKQASDDLHALTNNLQRLVNRFTIVS